VSAEELWATFVAEGGAHALRLRDELEAGAPAASAAAHAYAIASLAYMMDASDVALLAHSADRALAFCAAVPARAGEVAPLLADAAAGLVEAFDAFAHPDASGARADPVRLAAARAALERFIDEDAAPAPPSSEAAPAPAPPAEPGVWVPAVDDDMVELFFEEAQERLEGMAQKLVELESQSGNLELVRDLFRDLHTLKGSSGMVGLLPMNHLAHAAEDLVGLLRDGKRAAERPVIDALLGALDGLRALCSRAAARQPLEAGLDLAGIVTRLRQPGAALPAAPAPIEAPAASPAPHAPAARPTLRVDFDKLDLLLNLVGELVLAKSGLGSGLGALASLGRELEADRRLARRAVPRGRAVPAPEAVVKPLRHLAEELGRVERVFVEVSHDLEGSSARLDRVAADLRDQVIKLRMVPIAATFRKHHRTVRDLAHALGKRARLELVGEDTELDKVLVEQLDDPLLHAVRNAVDHGLESPAARAAAGKPPEGQVRLSATHRGNQIVITIADDGGGIDPARLRAKAVEKGLASAAEVAAMDDRQALELIFRPGFSTAAQVSEVSGRGVGMDVVRETIVSRLKGTVEVDSQIGRGTTLTLRLPLTLAIIQVLLARSGGEVHAVPLDIVRRTLSVRSAEVRLLGDREVLAVRGERDEPERQVPLVRLAEVLELPGAAGGGEGALPVILVDVFGGTYGLVCDRLLGKQEIVIKSLGAILDNVPCAAGATLLGDRPALILDVPALVQRALALGRRAPAAPAPAAPVALGAPRVLLVEDSDTIRAAMQRMLEAAGYHVTPARDGAEGLRLAESADFALISTDVMMPNLDGYELTRALRASARHASTPIIMVTGRGEKIDRVRGFDAGVDEYLTKPHDRQEFLGAVARHLGRKP
jgi:two-component system chemotaxis sensor kinase CheA